MNEEDDSQDEQVSKNQGLGSVKLQKIALLYCILELYLHIWGTILSEAFHVNSLL